MPRLDLTLSNQARVAIGIVTAGEIARATGDATIRAEWSRARLEALHELAYLRVFAAWEVFLESVFYRSLCGYASSSGQEILVGGGAHFPNLAAAEQSVLGRNTYLLWHHPQKVIDRCKGFIDPSGPCRQEMTIASNYARLLDFSNIRHRIVHDQIDAKRKFDAATMTITGRIYQSSRPGRFLRDSDTSTAPPRKWLLSTIAELTSIARQIVD